MALAMPDTTAVDIPLAYAAEAPRPPGRVLAGALLLVGGVALVLLGGCFLIGNLILVKAPVGNGMNKVGPLTPPQIGLMWVLYVLAASCLAGAVLLFVLGTSALLRIARS